MHIEFIGLPGSGKTTIKRELMKSLARLDKNKYLSVEEAFLEVSCSHMDSIFRYPLKALPKSISIPISKKLVNRSIMQFDAQNRYLSIYGKGFAEFLLSPVSEGMSKTDCESVIAYFLASASLQELISSLLAEGHMVIFDEGLLQKSLMFVDHASNDVMDNHIVFKYLENIPIPELTIYIKSNIEICCNRMESRPRGLTKRLKGLDRSAINNFMRRSKSQLDDVSRWVHENTNKQVLEISHDSSVEEAVRVIVERIQNY